MPPSKTKSAKQKAVPNITLPNPWAKMQAYALGPPRHPEKAPNGGEIIKLTPGNIRYFQNCSDRMWKIYDDVVRDKVDIEVARLNRLVDIMRGGRIGRV